MADLANIAFDEDQVASCCGATEISSIRIRGNTVKEYNSGVKQLTEWLNTHGPEDGHDSTWVNGVYKRGPPSMTYGRRICFTTVQDGEEIVYVGDDGYEDDFFEVDLEATARKEIWKKHGWELREFPGNHGSYEMWFLTYIPKHKINKEFLEKINKSTGSSNLSDDGNNAVSRRSRLSKAA